MVALSSRILHGKSLKNKVMAHMSVTPPGMRYDLEASPSTKARFGYVALSTTTKKRNSVVGHAWIGVTIPSNVF